MSDVLIKARQQLAQVKTLVKQEKLIPATQALQSALAIVIRSPLLAAERTEFEGLICEASQCLASNPAVRSVFPLSLSYAPGKERALLETVKQLGEVLEGMAVENAEEHLHLLEARKRVVTEQAQTHLDKKEFSLADELFEELFESMSTDISLICDIGDRYLKAERYESAFEYFSRAIEIDPSLVHLYNRIGTALRKLGEYETAEKYYFKALQYAAKDLNLFFNIGRLYVEWEKWAKAEKVAGIILKLDPKFKEAGKMLSFVRKRKEEIAARQASSEETLESKP